MSDRHGTTEFDAQSGHATTGHEWDGITELDRPLPRWWLWIFYGTIAWSIYYVIAYPAIPLIDRATKGLYGYSSRATVAEKLDEARAGQAQNLDRIASMELEEIRADDDLARFAAAGGASAFKVNCVQCHGFGAAGAKGYPNLNDDDWLWGGTLEEIHATIQHGVRYEADDESRFSEMPAFGADALLEQGDIAAVAEYVVSLSGGEADATLAEAGATVFTEQCQACHGEGGAGNREFGAPALNDAISLYGSDREQILAQLNQPSHGVMPAWAGRLDETVIKQLAIYVHALGGGETGEPGAGAQ